MVVLCDRHAQKLACRAAGAVLISSHVYFTRALQAESNTEKHS